MGKKCGAKTRSGEPCKRNPMPNGRCKLHGGASKSPPKGNKRAEKHGFFSKIMPDDPELMDILHNIELKTPLDILWENIVIQYMAIVRAQKLMYVRTQEDHSEFVLSSSIDPITGNENFTKMVQPSWDKHASFLQAQAKAMSNLESMLTKYEAMLPDGVKMEEQRLKIAKLKVETERLKNPEGDAAEDWATALEIVAERRRKKRNEQ